MKISFNKHYLTGKEAHHISESMYFCIQMSLFQKVKLMKNNPACVFRTNSITIR